MTQQTGPVVHPLPPGLSPDRRVLEGHWTRLEPLDAHRHADQLFHAIDGKEGGLWTYMAFGPFDQQSTFASWIGGRAAASDAWFYAYVHKGKGRALGMGSFMRADPVNGVIEIGSIWMSPELQRSRESTEAIFLMMKHAFDDLGVRRLEWKCDALNAPSRRAAERFGFSYEGIFRQHLIIKGRNRDTAWYAMIDADWPEIRQRFEGWLQPSNFDAAGQEKAKLQVR